MRDRFELLDAITGYQPAAVVTAAWRVGIFDVLDGQPRPVEAVAAAIGAAGPGATGALLRSLAALGLVGVGADGYTATTPVAEDLRADAPFGHVVAKEAVFARLWTDLDRVVRDDAPLLAGWRDRLHEEPERCRAFLDALDVLAHLTGPPLAALSELAPGRRVLDIGGGLGSYARALAAAGSRVTLVELPPVASWAGTALSGAEGVVVVEADVLTEPTCGVQPGGHDAALLSHLLHDLDDEDVDRVLTSVVAALGGGGHVVVSEFAGDVGPGAFGPLFDLMMRVETGASARPLAELVERMAVAGVSRIRRVPLPDPLTVLVGTVRGTD